MNEAEWLSCDDPGLMLDHLEGRATDRKLRLFAVACCRRIWHLLDNERSRKVVEVTERYADGFSEADTYRTAMEAASHVVQRQETDEPTPATAAWMSAYHPPFDAAYTCGVISVIADRERMASRADWWDTHHKEGEEEAKSQVDLMRCIFGNPFRPITIDPDWLMIDVVALARSMYDETDLGKMPQLAESLEKWGCTNADVLKHCRRPGPHAKGCWVVDSILGKT